MTILCYYQEMNLALKSMSENENRWRFIDQLRGIAVILMVFFHLSYDLHLFGHIEIDPFTNLFWYGLPRVIVFLFLICVGMSLKASYSKKINWKKFWKRFAKLSLAALAVSISTYFLFPDRWIYFGTLHCIALCSLFALPLLRQPKLALAVAILLLATDFAGYRIPWIKLEHSSMDYIPIFPWIAVVWLGFFLYEMGLQKVKMPSFRLLELLGAYSLPIYLLHQPLLFGILTLAQKLSSWQF